MDPRDRSLGPEFPEPSKFDFPPDGPVDSVSPTERFGVVSNASPRYGRHAAKPEDHQPDFPSPQMVGTPETWEIRNQDPTDSEYAYPAHQSQAQPQSPLRTQVLEPQLQLPERPEASQRRGIGAVWISVVLLLVAGVALLVAFSWLMNGGGRGKDEPAVIPAVPSTTSELSESPSETVLPSPAEPAYSEQEAVPEVPTVPVPSPDQLQDWSNQLNDDINGLISDFESRFGG